MRRCWVFVTGLAFVLVASPGLTADRTTSVAAGVSAAARHAAGALPAGSRPFVEIVCPVMQQQAEARGLPPMPFVRLIWRESRFDPNAVSYKGAQGIAQFMPATAARRGLEDPFEPISAIEHSASLLADLKQEFGNFGLAAAAYNAGEERVSGWMAGKRTLPGETRRYVRFVTGRAAEDWTVDGTELPKALKTQGADVLDSCRRLAPLVVRAVYESEPLTASGAWRPWGAQISTAFSKTKALAQFSRVKRRHGGALPQAEPFVLPKRHLSRGRRPLYMVQIGASSRKEAAEICGALRRDGGACIVKKN